MVRHSIVKVRVRRGDVGEDMMCYPARYDAYEIDRSGLGPCAVQPGTAAYSGHIGMGGAEEWCLLVLPESLAADYAKDAEMEVITTAVADTLLEAWRVLRGDSEEVVRDADRLTAIQAKQAASVALSTEDLKALDPNDKVLGINKRLTPMADVMTKIEAL